MIIFNTTYHADHSRKDEFISWLKNFYIPAVLEHGALQEPQLTRIFAENEEEDRKSTRLNSSHMPKSRMPSSA